LLLNGAKRNALLRLWEIQRYGSDSYRDADYVSLYGMRPAEWYARGVRILGRTAVECTRDALGNALGRDIAAVVSRTTLGPETLVIDPFAGSANTLFWMLRHLSNGRGLGFELDRGVFRLTRRNLATLHLPIEISNTDYRTGLNDTSVSPEGLLIVFLAPPCGEALNMNAGLDLRRTTPPIGEILDFLNQRFDQNRLLCGIQIYETLDVAALVELRARFVWSELRVYDFNVPGQNHGILMGTSGWTP
jgi:hypothetical protein